MKKFIFSLAFSLLFVSLFAQSVEKGQHLKYTSSAPDGSTALSFIDDIKDNLIKLESVYSFYKYQLLDIRTSEPVLSSFNRGNTCSIDKSRITPGTYSLRLFTKNFIITTVITLSEAKRLMEGNDLLASE
ncbi:MAG: hypothetical protein KDC69_06110 [Flavobacteriaceae bacterium]|nr:hypothetical protein [Flavobacteriaceae bacterium]